MSRAIPAWYTWDMPVLTAMDVAGRLTRTRAAIDGTSVDALLVTNLTNVRYLTGFTGSAGLLFLLPHRSVLLTDGRYETQSAEELAEAGIASIVEVEIAPGGTQQHAAMSIASGSGPLRIGLEAAHVSWASQRRFEAEWFPNHVLVPTEGLIERLREVKDAGEVARLCSAAQIADDALAAVRPLLGRGPTEIEFGLALDTEMRRLGATRPSFETIVASGPNAAKPHHRPSARPIGTGEPVVIDFGAVVDGYCSDMTRTVWVDGIADAELRRAVDVVAQSQAAGVAAVRAGVACSDVDAACREVIEAAGLGDRFVHGTGHGVGLDIHEAPAVAARSTDTLQPGHVVTVEPGVYLPGLGGVRIEDTVVVTEEACTPLTRTPKDAF